MSWSITTHKIAGITQDEKLQAIADRQFQVFAGVVEQYPVGHAMFLLAALQPFQCGKQIVLSGKANDALYDCIYPTGLSPMVHL
ncbi:hypothetical protein ACP8HI_10385 [Paenibacillus sp. FA6]|uniref:hypothetical protein n=1 Tax=Paenibacillus sp. FA6 TaxID=3413029 RepID=UPI003F656CBF